MAIYQLQAKLKNESVVNLDFRDLNPCLSQLVEIDYFTNQYSAWDFLSLANTHAKYEMSSAIDSIQISVKGKEFSYSACFKNPYLDAIFSEAYLTINRNQIPMDTNAFVEMVEFLFLDLEQKGNGFLNDYPYKNRFSEKIHRYLNIQPLSEESMHERRILRQEIIHEMSEYKVYRSLCIYRKKMDRKKNQIPRMLQPVDDRKHLGSAPEISKTVIYQDEEDGVVTQYVSSWENFNGEEREEFLSEEEINQMVKTYE